MIEKLQEGQDALALTQAGIVDSIGAIPFALPFRTPEAVALAAGSTTVASPIVECPIDLKVLEEYGFPNPTYVRDRGVDFMREIMINVDSKLKSLGGMKSTKDVSKKAAASKKISALQDYKQKLEKYLPQTLPRGKKTHVTGKRLETGLGHETKNPYKLTQESTFGNLYIDPTKLLEMRLEAYKGDKKVMSRKVDADLLELLTKRFNAKKTYSGGTLKTWNKLVELSGLPPNKQSKKYQIPEIKYYKSPDDLCRRLEVLISSRQAGNDSISLNNEIVEIIDKLLVDGVITEEGYKTIKEKYVG